MVMAKEITEIEDSSNKNKKAIAQIRKRDKGLVDFNNSKISNAIYKALMAAGKTDYKLAERLSEKVVQKMDQQFSVFDSNRVPSVEDVQDMVESILIEEGLSETAKAYILYRHERRKIRDEKKKILNKKDLDEVDKSFDINSLRVLASRYLLRDNNNEITEDPKLLFERVAVLVTIPDILHDSELYSNSEVVVQNITEAEEYYKK
jgi:Oxygen-sensitive ribonucleoside-triphosphate reductase